MAAFWQLLSRADHDDGCEEKREMRRPREEKREMLARSPRLDPWDVPTVRRLDGVPVRRKERCQHDRHG